MLRRRTTPVQHATMTLDATHRWLLGVGGVLSLVVIPAAISSRRRAFLKRCVYACIFTRLLTTSMQQLDRMLNQPITPTSHTYTRREDLKYDNVAIMWEKIFVLKAVLDAFLGVLLLISKC